MSAKRALSPSTNPAGLMSAAAAIYAAVVMIVHVAHHQGVIDPQVIVSGVAAAAALYTRFLVTPTADPRDGNGKPLTGTLAQNVTVNIPAGSGPEIARQLTDALRKVPRDPMERP